MCDDLCLKFRNNDLVKGMKQLEVLKFSYEEVLGHEVFFTPVDAFLSHNGLYRKYTRDIFIVKYLSIC